MSIWGVSLVHARELYIKVICNTITYRVLVWYIPTKGGQPRGLAKALFTMQSECLYIVTGMYRATPIYCLERKVDILSIDIYFNKRVADFERRLMESGMAELISNSNIAIAIYLCNRYLCRCSKEVYPEIGPVKAEWANKWLKLDLSEDAIYRDWKERWRQCVRAAGARCRPYVSESAERKSDFDKDIFEKHRGLLKYKSSVLI